MAWTGAFLAAGALRRLARFAANSAAGRAPPLLRECTGSASAVGLGFLTAAMLAAALAGAPGAVRAQSAVQSAPYPPPAPGQKAARQAAPAARAAGDTAAEGGRGGDAQLRQRVEQLEEQLMDLQVVIGTLESLARNPGNGAPPVRGATAPAGLCGSDAARLDALETQIRALTAQLEQLADQVRAGEGRRAGAGGAAGPVSAGPPREVAAARPALPAAPAAPAAGGGFGATIVAPSAGEPVMRDPAARALGEEQPGAVAAAPLESGALASEGPTSPKQLYETAYGYLLQQNYPAAESAFDDFLRRYPADPLAGNAQYWLGESLFVRGQYKAAATAFLKGYQSYGRSAKAPDSLLKLAMSLDRLGQKEAACSSYAELGARFPNAPAHVKSRAQSERQRVGC